MLPDVSRGGGGGGANIPPGNGGNGGSGIVIVSYPISYSINSTTSSLLLKLSSSAISSSMGFFSLKSLNNSSAKVVRVRRSTDNATQDFYSDRNGYMFIQGTGQSMSDWLGSATGYVNTWYDQSSLGNNATQATAGNQPVIFGNYINWLGINNNILTASGGSNPTSFTLVFFMYEYIKNGTFNQFFGTASTWRAGSLHLVSPSGSTSIQLSVNPAPDVQTGFTFTEGRNFIVIFTGTISGGTTTVNTFINGTAYTGSSTTGITAFQMQSVNLGNWDGDPGRTFNGSINNIYMFSSALGTSDRQLIEGYVAWSNNSQNILPTNHPYYNYPPINIYG